MRAVVPLAVAVAVVVAPQAGSGGASAFAPEAIIEPTQQKLTSLEAAELPRTKIAAEVRRAEGGPAVVGEHRPGPAHHKVKNSQ